MYETDLQESLNLLLGREGITPNALAVRIAEKIDPKMTQAKVRRITSGESREPKDSSIRPMAQYFGLTVAQVKDLEYVKRFIAGGMQPNQEREDLIKDIDRLTPEQRKMVAGLVSSILD